MRTTLSADGSMRVFYRITDRVALIDAETDLEQHCSHMSKDRYLHDMSHMKFYDWQKKRSHFISMVNVL